MGDEAEVTCDLIAGFIRMFELPPKEVGTELFIYGGVPSRVVLFQRKLKHCRCLFVDVRQDLRYGHQT